MKVSYNNSNPVHKDVYRNLMYTGDNKYSFVGENGFDNIVGACTQAPNFTPSGGGPTPSPTLGKVWHQSNITEGGYYGFSYGAGRYFCINSDTDTTLSSLDGKIWTDYTINGLLCSVIPVNNLLTGYTKGEIIEMYVSTDGINWVLGSRVIYNVVYYNGFYYGCLENALLKSTDGIDWEDTELSAVNWVGVANNNMFLVSNNKFCKFDGNSLTELFDISSVNAINYCGDKYYLEVEIGGEIVIKVSSDGLIWSDLDIRMPIDIISYSNGIYFSLNLGNNSPIYSNDGLTWSDYPQSDDSLIMNIYAYDNIFIAFKIIMVDSEPTEVNLVYSYDGFNWVNTDTELGYMDRKGLNNKLFINVMDINGDPLGIYYSE